MPIPPTTRRRRGAGLPLWPFLVLTLSFTGACGPASAEPALWRIQGPKATVYLFGTVHVLKPDTVWRSAKIDTALRSAGSLWLEIPDSDDAAAMQRLVIKYGVDREHPLSGQLDPKTKADLAAFLAKLDVPAANLDSMRPWLAGLTLSILPLMKAGYDPNAGVERIVKAEEMAAGKPVRGFETAEAQIRYLADQPADEQIEFLRSSLDDADKADSELDTLVKAWAAGDVDSLQHLMNDDMREKYPRIYKLLLTDRNGRFAAQIADLVKGDGVVFVAIGAAHLVGPDSVQADLARLGITATRQ